MATQTIEFIAASGLNLSANLFAINSDTVVQSSSSVSEETNRKSVYNAVFTDVPAGTYQLVAFSGANSVAIWEVDLTLTTATFRAYDPLNPVSIRNAIGLSTNDLDSQLSDIKNSILDSSSLTLYTVFTKSPERKISNDIIALYNEIIDIDLVLIDEDEQEIDPTNKTLKVIVEDSLGEDVLTIPDSGLIKATGNVVFTLGQSVTANLGVYKYSLRDITNKNEVLAYGNIDVQYVAESGDYP